MLGDYYAPGIAPSTSRTSRPWALNVHRPSLNPGFEAAAARPWGIHDFPSYASASPLVSSWAAFPSGPCLASPFSSFGFNLIISSAEKCFPPEVLGLPPFPLRHPVFLSGRYCLQPQRLFVGGASMPDLAPRYREHSRETCLPHGARIPAGRDRQPRGQRT